MSDRPASDDPTGASGTATPKPKVIRARTTAVGTPAPTRDAPASATESPPTTSAGSGPKTTASPPPTPKPTTPTAAPPRPAAGATKRTEAPERATTDIVPTDPGPAHGYHDVEVEVLNLRNGGIDNVKATRVDVRQGGISRVDAREVTVTMGGIAIARADRMSANMSGVGLALSGESRIRRSFVRNLFARDVRLDQSAAWSVLGGRVTFERQSFAGVVIARRVDGDIRPLMDWRGALAFAGVVGVLMAVVRKRR
jgi:hypothetical protein